MAGESKKRPLFDLSGDEFEDLSEMKVSKSVFMA